VSTPHEGITLAGDFVRLPIPSALMERAVASGFLAANKLLAPEGVRPEPIRSIPRRGLLGRRPKETAASSIR
jgi:isorenieratene synthase